jgi:hypothetical protein
LLRSCSPVLGGTEDVDSSGVVVVVEVSEHLLSPEGHSLHEGSIVEQFFKRIPLDTSGLKVNQ